jgi:malate dehydrogenase (oxaloacetate-decarboxylating)
MANQSSKDEPHPKFKHLSLATSGPLECALSVCRSVCYWSEAHRLQGTAILRSPYFNKGSAFSEQEREDFGLNGLLPSAVNTLEEQLQRAYQQYQSRGDDLAKNTFMESLKEQNQVLYYRVCYFNTFPAQHI